MNKFMRLFAVLLVVAAVILIVVSLRLGHKPSPAPVATSGGQAPTVATTTPPAHDTHPVVTAATTLAPGEPIRLDDLRVAQRATSSKHAYTTVDDVAGKIPAIAVPAGTGITSAMLLDDLSTRLQPGERAVAIPVSETTGVANRIHPGDYVDVFFSLEQRDDGAAGGKKQTQARLLLPRLRVLAYGPRDLPRAAPAGAASSDTAHAAVRDTQFRNAVLAVPLAQVNRLLLVQAAGNQGKLSLALRNPRDTAVPDTDLFARPSPVLKTAVASTTERREKLASADNHAYAGISLDGLAEGHVGASTDARPVHHVVRRSSRRSVDVIRGTERSQIHISQ